MEVFFPTMMKHVKFYKKPGPLPTRGPHEGLVSSAPCFGPDFDVVPGSNRYNKVEHFIAVTHVSKNHCLKAIYEA
jgi:hypothetical protein